MKKIVKKILKLIEHLFFIISAKISNLGWKEFNELSYWKHRKRIEGVLKNKHYKYFYTDHFNIAYTYYDGKILLDIGCGPRGSIEWACSSLLRIGLDPLASEYLTLGANKQRMKYICACAENIPLINDICDTIFSFNSLDHVENIEKTLSEIKRIIKPDGIFLLLIEVNHPPTDCEPHRLTPKKIIDLLKPEFTCEYFEVYKDTGQGMYQSIKSGQKIDYPCETLEQGYMSAKFLALKRHITQYDDKSLIAMDREE